MTEPAPRVIRFPSFLRRKQVDPIEEGRKELEVQYQIYQLLQPLSQEARERAIDHTMTIFRKQQDYNFED